MASFGFDWNINEPLPGASSTYTINCTGGGGGAEDSIVITKTTPPIVSFEIAVNGGVWGTSSVVIISGDEVSLSWSSTGANSCSGGGFFTGGGVNGLNDTITEPLPGTATTYTLSCSGPGTAPT